MSGFERANAGDAWTDAEELPFPDDFNLDETAFAAELRGVFAVERDDLPPLYVQTLLAQERSAPAEPGFEHKVVYRVFRRLRLQRPRLVQRSNPRLVQRSKWRRTLLATRDSLGALSRPLVAAMTAAVLFMAVTLMIATPSFAAGLRIILGQTGVQRVTSYPSGVHSSPTHAETVGKQPDPFTAGAPLYWLGPTFKDYAYAGLQAEQTDFARGAMIDVQYVAKGTGDHLDRMEAPPRLDIREFRVSDAYAAVLQVVSVGSTAEVSVGADKAIYVDGSWACYGCQRPVWLAGARNQLIFEHDGVIFWLSGDQREGVDQASLMAAAKGLAPVAPKNLPTAHVIPRDTSPDSAAADPSTGEVLELVPAGELPDSGVGALVTAPTRAVGGGRS